uniref:C2 domain-containing protein n=1 Tax=Ciona intestinalis TaxID=7719 RepID=F6YC34_CIOIN
MSRQQKKPQVKLEEKQLVFQFGITQAQFNRNGSFLLVLTIKNAHRQDLIPQVLLEVNNNGSEVYEHSISTDTVKWSMESQAVTFNTNMFKFTLPTGFCKNDKNYDVHLLIEAYALSGKRKERVGEALFAIYPRTEMPRANLHVKKGEDFYRYSGIITLLRPLSRSSISMHCGRLSYTVALKEFLYSETGYVDRNLVPTSLKSSKETTFVLSKDSLHSEDSFHISMSPTPSPDYHLPSNKQNKLQSGGTKGPVSRHVAKPGHEEVYVIMHGATSLPSRSDGIDPLPFATLKSLYEEKGGRPAQCATHATLQPTHSPTWEEVMTMQVPEDRVEEEELIVTISDSESKEKLVTYRLPIINLVPFHPYHFELVQVTLQDFQRELKNPAGPLLAVGRIVPDYTKYKDNMLSRNPCIAGITTSTITFPSPNPASFQVLKEHQQGFPQLTTPSKGSNKPEWNHSFMFCSNDTATMFSHNSALVIEFYPASTTMSSVTWTIRNPIGFATLLLDEDVFQAVKIITYTCYREPNQQNTPVMRPDTLAVPSNSSVLPVLDAKITEQRCGLARNKLSVSQLQKLVKDDEFPPKDVLELMKYREAVKRMSNDMISLRQTNAQLQDDNAALRRELMLTKEVGHDVMNDINNGVISSKHKLAKETDDLKSYKAKVQHLQNQMIKANEREKQYLTKMPSPKELQNNTQQLQDKQRKLKKLEATCQQQEKVIQKMEKLLNK